MKRFLSFLLAFIFAAYWLNILSACGKKTDIELIQNRISLSLPDRLHAEYGYTVFVKDGNEYYLRADNLHGSHRNEIYMRRELSTPVCVAEGYGGWNFITARYDPYLSDWQIATEDDQNEPWNANDKNQNSFTKAEYTLRTGYSDINMPYDMEAVTITQKSPESLVIAGNRIDCEVWEYLYDDGEIYVLDKYFFAADTKVFLKKSTVFDREDDIDAPENTRLIATYYAVGESMDEAMTSVSAHIGEIRTKYIFSEEFR